MATMRSSASSNGPGMGARPSAASPRSGRGMRLSVAAIFTARRVLLKLFMEQRDSAQSAERRRAVNAISPMPPQVRGGKYVVGIRAARDADFNDAQEDRGDRKEVAQC